MLIFYDLLTKWAPISVTWHMEPAAPQWSVALCIWLTNWRILAASKPHKEAIA